MQAWEAQECDSWLNAVRRCSRRMTVFDSWGKIVIRGLMPLGVAQSVTALTQ